MESKVSIIVPVYKVEQYLERCIRSILNQTHKNLEIILVDDGSPDNCPQMCDEYASQHANVKVIHKENGGLSSARLAGFDVAQGEYILFVDSDDYIDEQMVEKLVSATERQNCDLAMCGYNTVCEGVVEANKLPYQQTSIVEREHIISDYILPLIGRDQQGLHIPGFVCVRLYKKSLIERTFFASEREYFLEDHVFNLYYADSIQSIAIVNEPLYYYCVNRQSLSNRYRKGKFQMYTNLYHFFVSYIQERKLENVEERLNNFLLSAFFASIDNAVQAGDYTDYKKELDFIINDAAIKSMMKKIDNKNLSLMQKIIIYLFKMRMYSSLYYLRKKRIEAVTA